MKLPAIRFSNWISCDQDDPMRDFKGLPGVYLLAHFRKPPRGRANPRAQEIVYIGETCNSLRSRWNQFRRSAFESKGGHGGGDTYRKKFGPVRSQLLKYSQRLYIAVFAPTSVNGKLRESFIRYVERKLLVEYYLFRKRMPRCNKK